MLNLKGFMNRREAASYLGVCLNTLISWEKKKYINFTVNPNNKRKLYKKQDLDNFLTKIN